MDPVKPTPPVRTKYADFITQAQEGIAQAIKTRSKAEKSDGESPLIQMLRKLMEDDDDKPTD